MPFCRCLIQCLPLATIVGALSPVVRTLGGLETWELCNEQAQPNPVGSCSTPDRLGIDVACPRYLGAANMEPSFLLIAMLSLGVGITLGSKLRYFDGLEEHNKELRDQLAKRRHTYPTANGLEDALAVTIDLLLREDAAKKYRRARFDQLNDILGKVREGPLAYDSDRANDRPDPE